MRESIFLAINNGESDEVISGLLKRNGMEHDDKTVQYYKENMDVVEQDFYDEWEALKYVLLLNI